MNTLYLRLPSAAAVKTTAIDSTLICSFSLATNQGVITRGGEAALGSLTSTIASAERVVLLVAASDVTLLVTTAPPLSAKRLQLALPSLIEEYILDDPEDCVIVAGRPTDIGLPLTIMRRDRLQAFADTIGTLGAKKVFAWPLQSCFPRLLQEDGCIAILHEYVDELNQCTLDICMQLQSRETIGLSLHAVSADVCANEALGALRQLLPDGVLTLMVPPHRVTFYAQVADADTVVEVNDLAGLVGHAAEAVRNQIAIPNMTSAAAIKHSNGGMRGWRHPLRLAVLIVLLNTAALNYDWWRLHHEASNLKTEMLQTYRARFPDDKVILDPLLQMQQKLAIARRNAGESAPDDFAALAGGFASAWNSLGINGRPPVESLDYRDKNLVVSLKSQTTETRSDNFQQQLESALANQKLELQETKTGTWQIRRAP